MVLKNILKVFEFRYIGIFGVYFMKKLLLTSILLIFLFGFGVTLAETDYYTVQLASKETYQESFNISNSYPGSQLGIKYFKGKKYYVVTKGKFSTKEEARNYKDQLISQSAAPADSFITHSSQISLIDNNYYNDEDLTTEYLYKIIDNFLNREGENLLKEAHPTAKYLGFKIYSKQSTLISANLEYRSFTGNLYELGVNFYFDNNNCSYYVKWGDDSGIVSPQFFSKPTKEKILLTTLKGGVWALMAKFGLSDMGANSIRGAVPPDNIKCNISDYKYQGIQD